MDKKELEVLKKEYEELTAKLKELSEEELKAVVGGNNHCGIYVGSGSMNHAPTFGEPENVGEIKPSSTKGWFGVENN